MIAMCKCTLTSFYSFCQLKRATSKLGVALLSKTFLRLLRVRLVIANQDIQEWECIRRVDRQKEKTLLIRIISLEFHFLLRFVRMYWDAAKLRVRLRMG